MTGAIMFYCVHRWIYLIALLTALSIAKDISSIANRLPSRPPAPLFQGRGKDFITVFFQLDPNDVSHQGQAYDDDGIHYELQIEKISSELQDFLGQWNTSLRVLNSQHGLSRSTTATVSELLPDEAYRFRVRVTNDIGPSPWSSPSESIHTKSWTPLALTNITAVANKPNSIRLSWDAADVKNYAVGAHFYRLQYRLHTLYNKNNALAWVDHRDLISALVTYPIPEVQEITTLVDVSSRISSGFFWLKLVISDSDPTSETYYSSKLVESSTISKPIPFDASSEQFQTSIESIRGIRSVRVFCHDHCRRNSSVHSDQGKYSWRVEFEAPEIPVPLFEVYKDNLDGAYSGGYNRVIAKRLVRGLGPVYKSSLMVTVPHLENENYYDFRVRGENKDEIGPWHELLGVKTMSSSERVYSPTPTELQKNSEYVKRIQGSGRYVGNGNDPDYISPAGIGGFDGDYGTDGIIVIISYGQEKHKVPSRTFFYFTGYSQSFVLPGDDASDYGVDSISFRNFIDVKLWGAGGAGGGSHNISGNMSEDNNAGYSHGGGGGYVQSRIKIRAGEVLTIQVGRGGIPYAPAVKKVENDVFDGCGPGGTGVMGPGGGSGGGSSVVILGEEVVAAAGGGGGGGATDYCCAHGGAGGGAFGGDGISPETPRFIGIDTAADGKIRNNFTPQDCKTDACIDPRDRNGLPPFHLHMDRGFAPNASYHIAAQAGIGGTPEFFGSPGASDDYIVFGGHISTTALPGGYGFGGKGADGKEGGGGGGGGYMGGGGGGSGVDGAGGGGGSGYIDFTFIYVPNKRNGGSLCPNRPNIPKVAKVFHDAIMITWSMTVDDGNHNLGSNVRGFDVEISRGRIGSGPEGGACSDDFELMDHVRISGLDGIMNSTIKNIYSDTAYCIQITAVSDNGKSERTDAIEVVTPSVPTNIWRQIVSRKYIDAGKVVRFPDKVESLCEIPLSPAPRRGHSLSLTSGNIYLFGGSTQYCICSKNASCGLEEIYSNEVWSFNTRTSIWKPLLTHNEELSGPEGREKHSASVLSNGKIIVIGGRTDEHVMLGDVWEMDPGQVTTHTAKGSSSNQILPQHIDGQISYHSVVVSSSNRPKFRSGELCVKGVTIDVSIEHTCIEQIEYISIIGPGPINSADITTKYKQGSNAKLFVSSAGLSECNSRVSNITFSDRAQNTILDHSYRLPISGTFRPAETLASSFIGKAVDGQWTLAIHESLLDSNPGRLLDWNIHFDLDYCSDGILWSKLSTKSNSCDRASVVEGKIVSQCPESCQRHKHVNVDKDLFTPRYLHSSVAVGNNVYVMGGYAHNHIHEMWRFDYESKFWIKLHGVRERPQWYGRSAVLSPFGVITFGGLKTGNGQSRLESAVLLHNLLNGTKSELKVESSSGVPQSRYLSAAVFIGWDHLLIDFSKVEDLQKIYSYIEPVILFFGGDIDLPNNNYLEDLWLLILKDVDLMTHNNVNLGLHDVCRPMLTPDKTDNNPWDWSCGSLANKNSRNPCRWEDVVLMAWCRGQYQSFFSPE